MWQCRHTTWPGHKDGLDTELEVQVKHCDLDYGVCVHMLDPHEPNQVHLLCLSLLLILSTSLSNYVINNNWGNNFCLEMLVCKWDQNQKLGLEIISILASLMQCITAAQALSSEQLMVPRLWMIRVRNVLLYTAFFWQEPLQPGVAPHEANRKLPSEVLPTVV